MNATIKATHVHGHSGPAFDPDCQMCRPLPTCRICGHVSKNARGSSVHERRHTCGQCGWRQEQHQPGCIMRVVR